MPTESEREIVSRTKRQREREGESTKSRASLMAHHKRLIQRTVATFNGQQCRHHANFLIAYANWIWTRRRRRRRGITLTTSIITAVKGNSILYNKYTLKIFIKY